MSSRLWVIGLISLGIAAAEVRAQFIPPPPLGWPVLVPNGVGFSYRAGGLRVGGFFSNGTYSTGFAYPPGYAGPIILPPYNLPLNSYIDTRISFNYITPKVILAPGPFPPLTSNYDLSGVDLDLAPVKNAKGEAPAPARAAAKKEVKLAKVDPPKKMDAPRVEPPKPAAAKQVMPQLAKADAAREIPPPAKERVLVKMELAAPRVDPVEESKRLVELGHASFREGNYGVAAWRFRQAQEADPNAARPLFCLAQANFALGKYHDAVASVEKGLRLQPGWPRAAFQPRVDFYPGKEEEWRKHRLLLEDSLKRRPNDVDLVLLTAHQCWFEGERNEATKLFQRAKGLVKNSPFTEAFLKAAEPVAVK